MNNIYVYIVHILYTSNSLVISHIWLLQPHGLTPHQAPLFTGILQARILEWVAMPSSRGSSPVYTIHVLYIYYMYCVHIMHMYVKRKPTLNIHWKRPWCWQRSKAGGEGDDRGWDGWMASPTPWTWVWANSRSWWWTGRPGVLRSMGSQRVGHDGVAEQQEHIKRQT